MASSSSATACPKLYDAFISHRGSDVKETLAKQLYELLRERGCRAFLDRPELQAGESIPIALRNAICSSLVQIAIFSPGYANSSWCLDELVLMLQQTDTLFIPVFYNVQPWELRHIENEKSQYSAAFSDYQSKGRYLDKLDEWRKALKSAADISGYELSQHPDNLCENIVSRVLQVVQNRIPLDVAKYPVGLAELVEDFESCLETRKHKRPRTMDKVTIAGIYGLGGSGKTTLAKELFNKKRSGYRASTFLFDVRESYTKGELHCLQSQLLKDLLGIEDLRISSVDYGIGVLKDSLERARHFHFLIVLDDIDHSDQLDALLPEGTLSSSSLVIITTRDQSMLRDADIRYKMKGLNRDHAKDLFRSHAFRGQDPPVAYEKLVESFVEFCGGLPLSLKVVGAHLYGKKEYYWKLELEKVKKIQPKDIMQRLKISFDGLDQEEQQIFIDIACFFSKTFYETDFHNLKRMAISIWKASGWSAEHALQTLQDKSLVEIDQLYAFEMHDHLRDLGRQMADDLGPRRLWRPQILRSMEAKGFKQILAETKVRCFHMFYDSSLQTKIEYFIGTSNDSADTDLLGLRIDNKTFNLEGRGKLEKIPSWIPLRKLHYLSVLGVKEMWSGFHQQLQTNTQASFELRKLEISLWPHLQKLPELIGMSCHLEELRIEFSLGKTDMTSLSESIKQLSNLRSLHLEGGAAGDEDEEKHESEAEEYEAEDKHESEDEEKHESEYEDEEKHESEDEDKHESEAESEDEDKHESEAESQNFNLSVGKDLISLEACTTSLETICVGGLANISKLLISQEICPELRSLIVQRMCNLKEMDLKHLERLETLQVQKCPKLGTISGLSSLTGLQSLRVESCPNLETISGLSSLTGLQSLRVESCPNLETISGLPSGMWSGFHQQLQTNTQASFKLRKLKIFFCPRLQKLPELIGMFYHLEKLKIGSSFEKTDMTSLSESIKQLSNLRSLHLWGGDQDGDQDQDQDQDQNLFSLEASTRRCITSLETIYFSTLRNISKLLISGEICPKLRSLTVHYMWNLKLMDLKHLESLNTLKVEYCCLETISGLSSLTGLQSLTVTFCDKLETISELSSLMTGLKSVDVLYCRNLETISGLSSLTGLQTLTVEGCDKLETISGFSLTGLQVFEVNNCEGLKSLAIFPHQRHLERFKITGCDELQRVEGFGEWPELKSLIIEVPRNGYAWVRNFIYGLKRLPSKETILVGMPVDRASSRLDVNLFSEVTDVQALEPEKVNWRLPSSSNAITIYVFLGCLQERYPIMRIKSACSKGRGDKMITVLSPHHDSDNVFSYAINAKKGFKVIVNKREEGKALTLMQRIVDLFYR